ncbi:MAG: two-component system NtrC family sensor kinase [Nitrospirae bacterium]|nr:MAG: two-component system NtrC family sensor kinase [Nitrospirota bacterium]
MDEPIKILCVDDEQNVLNALRRLFLDDNYEILTATSGADGLELQEREHAQIIISDYRMPAMTGVEFLGEVNRKWPDTVRIVLSGYADTAAIVSAINEGQIYKFIPKPWNDDEIRITVGHAIDRYFLSKKNRELSDELTRKNAELNHLLAERTNSLEQRGQMLRSFQNIIDAIPLGVLGLDSEGTLVQANEEWFRISGGDYSSLGQNVAGFMPHAAPVLERVRQEGRADGYLTVNGVPGRLIGSRLHSSQEQQEGIILVFIRRDEAP